MVSAVRVHVSDIKIPKNSARELAIIRTVAYADVFDYPLTMQELHRWLIDTNVSGISALTEKIPAQITTDGRYYYLSGRSKITRLRTKREKTDQRKLIIAIKIIKYLIYIPTITCIAVTGALAMDNAKDDDDIDICVITSSSTVWITRLLTVLILELFGIRRRPSDKNVQGKVCANMFLDENHLGLPLKERDLFSAHEVLQMKPLVWRGETYKKFLKANEWVKRFLPNAYKLRINNEIKKQSSISNFIVSLLRFFELPAKVVQLKYMQRRRSDEVIRDGYLRFHPQDARGWVMKKYKRALDNISSRY